KPALCGPAFSNSLALHGDGLATTHGADIAAATGREESGYIAVVIIKLQLAAHLLPARDRCQRGNRAARRRSAVIAGAGLGGQWQVELALGAAGNNGPHPFRAGTKATGIGCVERIERDEGAT